MTNRFRFSLNDLFALLTLCAGSFFVIDRANQFNFSAAEFAASLSGTAAGQVMVFFSFGIVVFPVTFLGAAVWIQRKTELNFRTAFAVYLCMLAILAVPVSYAIAKSCAFEIGG